MPVGFDRKMTETEGLRPWVAKVPALSGCYAMMPTKEEALEELRRVLRNIADDYQGQGKELPNDTTQIIRV